MERGEVFVSCARFAYERVEVHRARIERRAPGIAQRQLHEVVHQPRETLRLRGDGVHVLEAVDDAAIGAVQQQLAGGLDHGERRAQLVRGVLHEFRLRAHVRHDGLERAPRKQVACARCHDDGCRQVDDQRAREAV